MIEVALNGVAEGCVAALFGLGIALPFAVGRFIHFAHGAICVAGLFAVISASQAGASMLVALTLGSSVAATLCWLIDRLAYSPLRRRGAGPAALLVASLGAFAVLEAAVGIVWGPRERVVAHGILPRLEIRPGMGLTRVQATQIAVALLVFAALAAIWNRSSIGLRWRACGEDPVLAELSGISVARQTRIALVAGSVFGCVAAHLKALEASAYPAMGLSLVLLGVVAAVIGGLSRPVAVLWGGLLVGLLRQGVGVYISDQWQDSLVFSVLFLFLLLRPQGIWGERVRSELS